MARNRLRAFAVGTGLSLLVLPGLAGLLKPLALRLTAPPAALRQGNGEMGKWGNDEAGWPFPHFLVSPISLVSPPAKPAPTKPAASPVAYRKVVAAGVPMHVVQVDLRSPDVRFGVATARYGIGDRDPWSALIDRTRPAAAITGTYFCTDTGIPVGSIVTNGQRVHTGGVGTAFAFSPAKKAHIVACRPGIRRDWTHFETVLRGGPRLLTAGRTTLYPRAEGFRDPAVFQRKHRTAVAITRHKKLLLVAVKKPVLLRTLAKALKGLGAVDAMCLDGGGSTALYSHGKTHVQTSRPLTNVLVVYDTTAQYQRYAGSLAPNNRHLAQASSSGRG